LVCAESATASRAGEDAQLLAGVIEDGIAANLRRIRSFELEATIDSDDREFPVGGEKIPYKRTIHLHVWHEGENWRQVLKTEVLSTPSKNEPSDGATLEPHEVESVFDGSTLRQLGKEDNVGRISPGRKRMEFPPSKDLRYGYSIWGIHLPGDLERASTISRPTEPTERHLVTVVFSTPEGIVTLWLNSDRGFMIERATAVSTEGRVVGERRATGFRIDHSACLLIGMREQLFRYEGDHRILTSATELRVRPISVNTPIAKEVFALEFPPGTLVVDEVNGTKYTIPLADRVGAAGPASIETRTFSSLTRWIVLFANLLFVAALLLFLAIRRLR